MNQPSTADAFSSLAGGGMTPPVRPRLPLGEVTRGLILIGLALVIYGFGIGRNFVFDDVVYISQNGLLHRSDALPAFWFSSESFNYYPLFWTLLRIQWLLWGDHSLGYHLVNLLVHCINAVLVWKIVRAWRLPGAWWVAALFAVHPINVQTLAWAAEQKNTWSFLFMALTTLAFIRHVERRDWPSYPISFICFLAALACKTSTVCLPLFLALVYAPPRKERRLAWTNPTVSGLRCRIEVMLKLIPFFMAGIVAGLTTVWFEQHRAGEGSLMATLSLWQRLEAAGAAFWFYLGKALLPLGLTPMYRGWVDTTAADHGAIPGLLLVLGLTALALFWRRIGAPIALGVVYYALMMLPLLGIFDTNYFAYSLIADHWQYHALPGLLVAMVTCARNLLGRLASSSVRGALAPRFLQDLTPVGAVTVATFALLASLHFAHFENARTLWTYTIARNPDAWIAWYNLGNDHLKKQEYADAIASYRESIRLKPGYYRSRFNLANALAASNQLEEADRAYLSEGKSCPPIPTIT